MRINLLQWTIGYTAACTNAPACRGGPAVRATLRYRSRSSNRLPALCVASGGDEEQEYQFMRTSLVADQIIHDHTAYAAGAGAVPVPLLDMAAVAAVQVDLVRALSNVYEVEFDLAIGKSLIASLLGASLPRIGATAIKALPGAGPVAGGIAQATLSGAATYALGHVFKAHFQRQGTLRDLDATRARSAYEDLLARSKAYGQTRRSRGRRGLEETTTLLERLARLREQGTIDDDEFSRLKSDAVNNSRPTDRAT